MIMPVILFGGLFANNNSIGDWISWIQYISPIKYAAEALMQNEFEQDPLGIRDNLMEFLAYNTGYWNSIFILIALVVGFRIIALFSFSLMVKKFQ